MIYPHTKNSPHGPMTLVEVRRPPAWKGLFNKQADMVAAVLYVYLRPNTNELIIQDANGKIVGVETADQEN